MKFGASQMIKSNKLTLSGTNASELNKFQGQINDLGSEISNSYAKFVIEDWFDL